jgi:LmbE family N-acetylglucosaminyl deacetylase
MKRILIIAAHPDDEVLGCGGLISKYQVRNTKFKVIFIGEGSSARFKDPKCAISLKEIEQRNNAATDALKFLNIEDVEFYGLPCGRMDQVPIIEINKIIENAIQEFIPDTVLTHSPYDVNNDHRIVFRATLAATRPGAKNHILKLMSYEVLSSSEWDFVDGFKPNYFEVIQEENIQAKCAALELYESEVREYPFPRSAEGIRALAMVRGMQSGFKFAEAYHLIRWFQQ